MENNRKALLVVSFGTSHAETRKKTIEAIEADMREAFPDYAFYRAFTSPTIIRIMEKREGVRVDNLEEALERILNDGYRQVTVQPTHMIRGFEYDKMAETVAGYRGRFDLLAFGAPLFDREEDYRETARVIGEEFAEYRKPGTEIVLVGHGTEHAANASYQRFDGILKESGMEEFHVKTVEGNGEDVTLSRDDNRECADAGHTDLGCWNAGYADREYADAGYADRKCAAAPYRVVLAPLLIVAGEHAAKDMAGDDGDSWKSRFCRAGYEVECVMRGLGEYEGIRRIYVEHARAAEEKERRRGSGVLYGIGVGPGDPELLTLKAVRLIRACDVIMAPAEDVRESITYEIVRQAVPEIEEKECEGVKIPMTRDQAERRHFHEMAADRVIRYLDEGKNVAFLNLGDVTVYASYQYIHRVVKARGYRAELVNGITSFTAAAACLGTSVAEDAEQIHVLSQPEQIEEGLKLPGTKIIMKMGKNMAQVKEWIREAGLEAMMVERCGMEGERIMRSVDEIDEHAGYYSLLIVKGNG